MTGGMKILITGGSGFIGTNLVDYYGDPKFAYFTYRDAMKPWHISLRYEALLFRPGETFNGCAVPLDDLDEGWDEVSVRVRDNDGNVLYEYRDIDPFDFSFTVPQGVRYFTVTCFMGKLGKGGKEDTAEYLFFVTDDAHPYADQEAAIRYLDTYPRS